ncbi:MAG: peptide-methionine (S)-S-oxide reductase MsrA [Bacteroidales bacterium]|nr:peptide-methionine (S)-S-oxide reductase MsrA [Bacteroidales bacterium]
MEKEIYLAAGCFWGAEHYLKQIEGVTFTEVGFANGNTANPTYQEVYTDTTGYAETVHLRYDPLRVSLRFLLEMYFKAIDPTSLNQQGEDRGTRYRTGIYYTHPDDLPLIQYLMAEEAKHYALPLQVEVMPLANFYRAEDFHQDYLVNNPTGYCHLPVELFAYARTHSDSATLEKSHTYTLLLRQAKSLADGETDTIALMANMAALLHETMHFWWTGFYRVVGDELLLGPFQGPVACMHIAYGRGVCGSAWQQRRTLVVPDVEAFPGHIACSAASRSEIVVPLQVDGNVVAVLDIDSQHYATFDHCDSHYLSLLADIITCH